MEEISAQRVTVPVLRTDTSVLEENHEDSQEFWKIPPISNEMREDAFSSS